VSAERGALAKIKPEVEYYQYQVDGVRKLCRMGSAILGDDMGLGKSLQALTVAAVDFEMGKADRLLIVAPASLKWNWAQEIEDHTLFTKEVLDGSPAMREKQLDAFNTDILIVGYEQVVKHVDKLNTMGFQVVIYDEAHMIKGHKSARTKACHQLRGNRHLLLSGSILLNHVDDLWSPLHRISPDQFPKYYKFLHRYALFGGFKDKEIVGIKNEGELREMLEVRMIRRLKTDVLDLPDKQYVPIYVELSPLQRRLYDQALEELLIELPDDPEGMKLDNALTQFLRLKMICGTSATIPGYPDHSNKLAVAVDRCADIVRAGEPVVVFTQFREVLACMGTRLTAEAIDYREIHGDVPAKDRVPIVKAWGEDAAAGKPQVLLAMLQVGGTGLNMTAANKCIFLDKLFVPKLNEQAEDRLHRIGADKSQPIQIIQMLTRHTIEHRVEVILKRKRKVFDTLVENPTAWRQKLYAALKEDAL
jgi:SNF2 family DNA or RNA helicase